MGLATWCVAGLLAWIVARFLPPGRGSRWFIELLLALAAALLAGFGATALDFGGWREIDWRAALFALLVSLTVLALFRLLRLRKRA